MKKKGFYKSCIALILVLSILLPYFSNIVSAASPDYIKEVRLSWDMKDSDKAENWLCDNGYNVVPGNLNAGTKKGYCYLGYKTTKNKDEAITDMAIISMDSGYKMYNYTKVIEEITESTNRLASQMIVALGEFRENYKTGSPNAKMAVEVLNMIQVDENDATPLGTYLLHENRTQEDIYNILLMGNSMVVSLIYNEITLGVSDYKMVEIEVEKPDDETTSSESKTTSTESEASTATATTAATTEATTTTTDTTTSTTTMTPSEPEKITKAETWMDRLSVTGPYSQEEGVDNGDDALYYDQAHELLDAFETYAKAIEAAQKRKEENNGEVVVNITTEKEAKAEDERIAAGGEVDESNADALNLGSYELLKQYSFGETNLAEYFMSLGQKDVNVQDIYPVVKSMTPGQVAMLRICGVTTSVVATNNSEENYQKAMEELQKQMDEFEEYKNGQPFHIYSGVNREIYSKEIAITEAGYRDSASGQMFDMLTKEDTVGQNLEVAMKTLAMVTVGCLGVAIIGLAITSFVLEASIIMSAVALWTSMTVTVGSFVGAMASLGPLAIGIVALAALIIIGVTYVVRWAVDLYDKYHPEYSPIPTDMYDVKNGEYLSYDAVLDQSGNAADMNNWAGQRWNALYVSYDTKAGSPLVVNDDTMEAFRVVQGSQAVPPLMDSAKHFGEKSAMNLNSHAFKDKVNGVYLYYHTELSLAGEANYAETGKYLGALVVASNKNATVAKAEIQKQEGYTVLDVNLTPNCDKATYIGYQTTSKESQAITDIRFSYQNNVESFANGTSAKNTYGNAGEINGLYLYYSKGDAVGNPILADLQVVNSLDLAPEDYEPVNLFSGGTAVNCGLDTKYSFVTNLVIEKDVKSQRYIYFRYETPLTSEETYLGGIAFVAMEDEVKKGSLPELIKQIGWTESNITLYSRTDNGGSQSRKRTREAKLIYTTTNNYKRAIYAIRTYEGEPKAPALAASINLDGNSYAACDTFIWELTADNNMLYAKRYINTTRAFLDAGFVNDVGAFNPLIPKVTRNYGAKQTSATIQQPLMGLYVSGPITGQKPIKMSEFYMGAASGAPSNLKPVVAMEDCYGEHPVEIAPGKGTYIYYSQSFKEKLPYIENIEIVYYDTENCAVDMCKYDLLSKGGHEIIDFNLASSSGSIFTDESGGGYNKKYQDRAAYIRVTRTSRKANALQDIRFYYLGKNDPEPSDTIKINDITYTKCSTRIKGKDDVIQSYMDLANIKTIVSTDTYFYVYTAKIGQPMTDITFSNTTPITNGKITALDQNGKTVYTRSWWLQMVPHESNAKSYKFIDKVYAAADVSLDDIRVKHDGIMKDKNANVMCQLLSNGCTTYVEQDFNTGRKDTEKAVYIGYRMTNAKKKKVDGVVKEVAITDLITDTSYKSSIQKNGCTYYPVSNCDLNVSVKGDYIYLYYTTGTAIGSELTQLRGYNKTNGISGSEKWEYVQKSGSGASNLNAGAYTKSGCNKESLPGIYLMQRRVDNSTKKNASLTASAFSDFRVITIVGMAVLMVLLGAAFLVAKKSKERKSKVK